MKQVPLKVLVIVLITGMVAVAGNFLLETNLDNVIKNHKTITEEYVGNREYMTEISGLLYHHQNLVGNCLLANSNGIRKKYKEDAEKIEKQLTEKIKKYGKKMKGGLRERLYHQMYSKFNTYKEQVDNLFFYVDQNDFDTAIYYNNGQLSCCIDDINNTIDQMDMQTMKEINKAQEQMDDLISISRVSAGVCNFTVFVLTVFCVIFCVRITSGLDHYKTNLERELNEKNEQLQIHNEKMLELQDSVIIGMANLIEDRDGDTGQHVRRTSAYVKMLAEALKEKGMYPEILTDKYIDRLVKAAPLHDVGKITIPDNILLKPGKLTPEEFEIIKSHSTQGGRIIRETFERLEDREYVKIADDVATYHHEKWDGSGYGKHLKGEQIPLSARIMAIADVFDALLSKRCYKEAMSQEESFQVIRESAGTHFDPALVEVFLGLKDQIIDFLDNETVD